MQDYNYVYGGCMELTLELSCCKYPYESELILFWNDNKQALLAFLGEGMCKIRRLFFIDNTYLLDN